MGTAFTTGLFIFFGLAIMKLGHKVKTKSHLPVIQVAGGRWAGTTMDLIITFFLFGALVTMAAGSGAPSSSACRPWQAACCSSASRWSRCFWASPG